MLRWLIHATGCDFGAAYGTFVPYNFWSGFGSDLAYLSVFFVAWRHLNCHQQGCWRLARHRFAGFCRTHMKGKT